MFEMIKQNWQKKQKLWNYVYISTLIKSNISIWNYYHPTFTYLLHGAESFLRS
jgi:hypothetical protein